MTHSMKAASEVFKVSIRTLYRWRRRYLEHGSKGLYDKSRRPKNPRRVSEEIVKQVIYIRKKYGIGCEKIATFSDFAHYIPKFLKKNPQDRHT